MVQGLQALLRWLFMQIEAVFNRGFGDRLNPFYHLGTITFWQFWLVIVSGLYLYIFAETGVHVAYESVERLTHNQWWAGGIMRSIHRYATDGMILTMMLHMTRHFAFDHYRGFRWFSWATGVIVLWMVYISGINGFMLVWDQLAQFVVVSTAEWLDVLPLFNGTLIRNFITTESVNSRLFTLLAFMHLGLPLVVGLILWVHVQRVPKARTNPPRETIIGLTLTYLVLSLVKPVLSQGGEANLQQIPAAIGFDWFQLPVLPLVYVTDPLTLWAIVIGLSVLLFLAPWLPPKRRGDRPAEFSVNYGPAARTISVRFDETLLDAGLRQEIALPYECRNGGCGLCKCTVTRGKADPGVYQPSALSAEELAAGKVLMCCAMPLTDIEISYAADAAPAAIGNYRAEVVALHKLNHDVMQVRLRILDNRELHYKAGQYLNIVLADGQRRAFSFANPPEASADLIELHIRLVPGGRFTSHVFGDMKPGEVLDIEGPLGHFVFTESDRPIVFVAGATGFAPAKSMIEDALRRGTKRPIYLYWGVRQLRDLYLPELPAEWERRHTGFRFIPVLSDPAPEDQWRGRTGLVHDAILADFPNLKGHEIYACGSVRMVENIFPALKLRGAEDGMCFSDAFTLSARSAMFQPPE